MAEFIGIMLGDGRLPGNHQLAVSFNNKTDVKYAQFICLLIKKLFSVDYSILKKKDSNGADIVVSSSNLRDFLLKQGLVSGNKVRNQVDVPKWIYDKVQYRKACLRGLIDTDGGLYLHRYISNGNMYNYPKLCFTNRSKPLLNFVYATLQGLNYRAYLKSDNVYIYSLSEVKRFFRNIGTHNPKHFQKIKSYLN